jgi:hypothetical protein
VLRGLDANGAALSTYEPPVVDLSEAERFDGTVTLYVHESPSPSAHRRFRAARERLELLEEAGVLEGARFVAWPERVESSTDASAAVRSLYERFRDAAGAAPLEPAFERSNGSLRVPALTAAARRDGRLIGLYPLAGATVEDATARLLAGDGVGNL